VDYIKNTLINQLNSLAGKEEWYVIKKTDDNTLLAEFNSLYLKHEKACKSILGIHPDYCLDPHKQASALCTAVLDLEPLKHIKSERKQSLYWYANEYVALQLSYFHIRCCIESHFINCGNIYNCDLEILDSIFKDFPQILFDIKPYVSNFFYLLRQEKILSQCSIYHKYPNNCSLEQCSLIERCGAKTLYNYLSLSKLFYHYDVMIMCHIEQRRKINGLPKPPPRHLETPQYQYSYYEN